MANGLKMPLVDGLYGDWDTVGRWFTEAESTFDKFGDEPMKECAELFYERLISNIESQAFSWKPLNQMYLNRKKILGLDSRTLIATSNYISGIEIKEEGSVGGRLGVYVGPSPDKTHVSGLSMNVIGGIHEYGTSDGRIPARPHYRPTWEEVRNDCRNIWLKHFRNFGK